jgi:hypothetical protein
MAGTQVWTDSRIRTADGRTSALSGRDSWGQRARLRLWILLNAQALLNGTARTAEDDRPRMTARRVNGHS